MVIEKKAEPDQPGRALLRAVRQDKAHRPDDVRSGLHQDFTLDQSRADQPELIIFEIAQAAVNELAGARRRPLRKIVLLDQQDRKSAPGRVAGDTRAIDAAADDGEVKVTEFRQGAGSQGLRGPSPVT